MDGFTTITNDTYMSNKFFEIFGKVVLVLILLGVVAGGAYYYGMTRNGTKSADEKLVLTTGENDGSTNSTSGSNSTAPTTAPVVKVLIAAGSVEHAKYTASVPEDWTVTKDPNNSNDMDKLTLTKNGYTIVIYQANMGGSMYSFSDAKVDGPFAQQYSGTFSDFTGASGEKFRRIDSSSQNKPGEKNYGVLVFGSDAYQTPTIFGGITYTTPLSSSADMLEEMDSIIASLKKQ